jgi:hypothetical protein
LFYKLLLKNHIQATARTIDTLASLIPGVIDLDQAYKILIKRHNKLIPPMQFRDSLATAKILIKYKGLGVDRNFPAPLPAHSATILDSEFVQPGLTLQTGKSTAHITVWTFKTVASPIPGENRVFS